MYILGIDILQEEGGAIDEAVIALLPLVHQFWIQDIGRYWEG